MSALTELPGFVTRNPTWLTKRVRESYEVAKAMAAYRKQYPKCQVSGKRGVHVHHVLPVSVAPELAASPDNFISLSPKLHLYLAHAGNWKWYLPSVKIVVRYDGLVKTMGYK